jgi:hypothetical protein
MAIFSLGNLAMSLVSTDVFGCLSSQLFFAAVKDAERH